MKGYRVYSIILGCYCFVAMSFTSFSQSAGQHSEHSSGKTSTVKKSSKKITSKSGTGSAGGMSATANLHSIGEKHMNEMMSMKMTGNVDEDFARMMEHHHLGAIEMSEYLLKSGKDSELKQMAQKIIPSQKSEVEKLRSFAKSHNVQTTDAAASKQLMESMHKMKHNANMDGSIDQQFATMMIDYHKCGVEMAEVEINNGSHSDLKEMAEKIKDEQMKEIEDLQKWQSEHKDIK